MTRRLATQTRYTVWRNTASIIKGLVCVKKKKLNKKEMSGNAFKKLESNLQLYVIALMFINYS